MDLKIEKPSQPVFVAVKVNPPERFGGAMGTATALEPISCKSCKEHFTPNHKLRIFCSDKCKYRYRDQQPKKREYDKKRQRELFEAGALKYQVPRWPKQRAEYFGVDFEPIEPEEIFERDGWICGVCKEPVDSSLSYPDPMCASMDHVIPWTAGGSHLKSNVQCVHLTCNFQKGSKLPENLKIGARRDRG